MVCVLECDSWLFWCFLIGENGRRLTAVACVRWGVVGGRRACVAYGRRSLKGIQPDDVAPQTDTKMTEGSGQADSASTQLIRGLGNLAEPLCTRSYSSLQDTHPKHLSGQRGQETKTSSKYIMLKQSWIILKIMFCCLRANSYHSCLN